MTSRLKKSAALLCMGAVLSIAMAEPALAQTANIEGVLQNIVNMLTGNVARLLATLAVIIVGIAWKSEVPADRASLACLDSRNIRRPPGLAC
jgi:type IV secretory pathway VirB2 component (pilin)